MDTRGILYFVLQVQFEEGPKEGHLLLSRHWWVKTGFYKHGQIIIFPSCTKEITMEVRPEII